LLVAFRNSSRPNRSKFWRKLCTRQFDNSEANMSIEIRVPEMGESVVDATVGSWRKHQGDSVQKGEALVELETDKVNLEVSAEQSGVLQQILKQEGEVVAVGDVLGMIGEGVEAQAGSATQQEQPAQATTGEQKPATEQREPSQVAQVATD